MAPTLVLHTLPPSHPCMTARRALQLKGLDFEEVPLDMSGHNAQVDEIYGEGAKTVPGLLVDGERVHGSRSILERLEEIQPEPSLYAGDAEAIREAEAWGDEVLQDLGRRLPWGALQFRPDAMGVLGGIGQLDPAGTDYAIRATRAAWKYHGLTAQVLHEDLQGLPGKLDHLDGYLQAGVIGGDEPNAADLQIGATLYVLHAVGDLLDLLAAHESSRIAAQWFGTQEHVIPAGAYPAGWVPATQ